MTRDEVEEARQDLRPDAAPFAQRLRAIRAVAAGAWCSTISCASISPRASVDKRNGKYLSHIAFVDMQKNLRECPSRVRQPVIPLGGLGCFDEHGIFPMNVLRHGGRCTATPAAGTGGSRSRWIPRIGLAISHDDGLTFQRIGDGPVLAASLHEPCLVGDGFVKVIGGVFHMWYIFGTGWKRFSADAAPDRTYKIGHAISNDGIDWVKEERGRSSLTAWARMKARRCRRCRDRWPLSHVLLLPPVFDFRTNKGARLSDRPCLLGRPGELDRAMTRIRCSTSAGRLGFRHAVLPACVQCDGNVYLLYNGNEFGRYGFGLAVLDDERDVRIRHEKGSGRRSPSICALRCRLRAALSERVEIDEYASKIVGQSDAVRGLVGWRTDRVGGGVLQ